MSSIKTRIKRGLKRAVQSTHDLVDTASTKQPHPIVDVWRPSVGIPAVLIRWMITEWCNYNCPYCPQTHERKAQKGNGMTAHSFDNFPVEKWIEAFERHFAEYRLSLVTSGGEPMVDRKNMIVFLNAMSKRPTTESVRIDTNGWWKADQYLDLDKSKIPSETMLNC